MLLLGLVEVPLWLILTLTIGFTLYFLGTRNHGQLKKLGIPGPTPYPFIGTMYTMFTTSFYDMHLDQKKKYGKVYGGYSGSSPEVVIFDEEMMSEITVKQFNNFTNRRSTIVGDPAFDYMITALKDDHWRHARGQMSPAFTTGKLRMMGSEINRCSRTFADIIGKHDGPFEARKQAGAFTMDAIASTAFGLRINSQEDEANCQFMKYAQTFTNVDIKSLSTIIFFVAPWLFPYLAKFGYSFFDRDAMKFFLSVVDQALTGRTEDKDRSRTDFLQLMVKAKQGHDIRDQEEKDKEKEKENESQDKAPTKEVGLNKEEILANALLFFIAGYDTTAATISFLLHHLAVNQDVQDRLYAEIDSVLGDKETVDYDSSLKMPYLEQCLQECLRLYPPGVLIDREATRDTEVCGYKIKKGTIITIPTLAVHRDPEIWPEPDKFDPERFSPEKKASISPFHWMPFGYGPRRCIAMRLALYELKAAVATLIRTHRVVTCDKTQIPLKLSANYLMKPEDGIWLTTEKRT